MIIYIGYDDIHWVKVIGFYSLNIVLLLPPAPAARVLAGLVLATWAALSAAFRLRIAVFGPPGGVGENGLAPEAADGVPGPLLGGLGDAARGSEDYPRCISKNLRLIQAT